MRTAVLSSRSPSVLLWNTGCEVANRILSYSKTYDSDSFGSTVAVSSSSCIFSHTALASG